MLFVGARVVPWILLHIARTRSRELFVLVALMAAVGTALAAAKLFGVSLALGAFLAGVVVSESPLNHQVGADVLPFREAFSVLFFVSVGMLVDPAYLVANAGSVLALTLLILAWKAIGEFKFIVGRAGVDSGMLLPQQYSLILASAVLSITSSDRSGPPTVPIPNGRLGRVNRRARLL